MYTTKWQSDLRHGICWPLNQGNNFILYMMTIFNYCVHTTNAAKCCNGIILLPQKPDWPITQLLRKILYNKNDWQCLLQTLDALGANFQVKEWKQAYLFLARTNERSNCKEQQTEQLLETVMSFLHEAALGQWGNYFRQSFCWRLHADMTHRSIQWTSFVY